MSRIVDLSEIPESKNIEEMTTEEMQVLLNEVNSMLNDTVESIGNTIKGLNEKILDSINNSTCKYTAGDIFYNLSQTWTMLADDCKKQIAEIISGLDVK